MDINNLDFLRCVASSKRPVIVSTGMSSMGEVEQAIETLRQAGSGPIALLHCISIYPPAMEDIHLRNIETLRAAFDVPVGFSDHSTGSSIALAAIALGACIIEKHFTLDKNTPGWDHEISADPAELSAIVREGSNVFAALGSTVRTISPAELEKRKKFRRRAVLVHEINAGQTIQRDDVKFLRPGTGIGPDETRYLVGRTVRWNLPPEHELEWSDLM
jgi:N-acetylneuraminate synthase